MADEIAYRDLRPGEAIQAGDEWKQMEGGRACWQAYHHDMIGKTLSEFCTAKARRPYNITQMNAAIAMQTEVLAEVRADEERLCQQLESLRSEHATLQQQRDQAAHEYRLAREALTTEQATHRVTMANGLQACKQRDDAEQALQMARASLGETRLARAVVIEERNEAERALSEERAAHLQTSNDRDRLISELSECQQQRQHLQEALEELQRRRDAAEAGYQTNTLTVGEVVENILSALEIASHALEYLADVGVNEEAGHYCGFSAAIAVVRKIKESTK